MRKLLLVLIIVCLYSMAIGAEPVGRQRAQQIAAQFLSKISISHRAPSASEMQAEAVFNEKNGMCRLYFIMYQTRTLSRLISKRILSLYPSLPLILEVTIS